MNEEEIRANCKQIYIKPEWQDAGDEKYDFFVLEDRGPRVLATAYPKDPDAHRFVIQPTQSIDKYMLIDEE